jgi:tetratricopeptide (TPR) repeat protein
LAETLYREAIAMSTDTQCEQHPSYGLFLGNFADLLRAEGRLQPAAKMYEKAIAVLETGSVPTIRI